MDNHAFALLRNKSLWEKMGLTKCEANHPGIVTSLLLNLILESQTLGGSFLNEFWLHLGKCHPTLQKNIVKLEAAPELVSETDVSAMLFKGIHPEKCNYGPIFSLAGEYFTHLGLTFMRPRDSLDAQDPYDHVYDPTEDTNTWADPRQPGVNELNLELNLQEIGLSREQILKYSAFNRDGFHCVITGFPLQYPRRPFSGIPSSLIYNLNSERYRPNLSPIIPILIEENPSALRCIEILAGKATRQLVLSKLFTVDNAMVLAYDARSKFDEFRWAIEALSSEKYIYRRIPPLPGPGPLYIQLQDGNEIKFGLQAAAAQNRPTARVHYQNSVNSDWP